MDIKIISGIVAFAIIALAIGLMIPGGQEPPPQTYPWQIDITADGATRVFGITLGKSTLRQAEQVFQAEAELSLFEVPDDNGQRNKDRRNNGQRIIEAYFDKVDPGGLSARVIAVMDIAQDQLQAIYQRGIRISTLGDGSRKVTLHEEDVQHVRGSTIAGMTYLPRIRLDTALLEKRFGKPAQVIKENDNDTTHWLYPGKGLDVALDTHGNAVLQYVLPSRFNQLIEPLK